MEMTQLVGLIFLCAASVAAAQEAWTPLNGAEIRDALTDRKLNYSSAWQDFRASGRTLYNAGQDSWGYWRVERDQYCSMWPPSDLWVCYDMARSDRQLRFIGSAGDVTQGIYADD